jgi:hypothetical protein
MQLGLNVDMLHSSYLFQISIVAEDIMTLSAVKSTPASKANFLPHTPNNIS